MAKTPDSGAWIEGWLSPGRFSTYLRAAGGSRQRALELYEWNARLSAAFLHDLSHLEVALRNACDRQLMQAVMPGEEHWTDQATLQVLFPVALRNRLSVDRVFDANKKPRDDVERARQKAASGKVRRPIPGKTVAEIMFGFWTYLLSDAHEKTIWVPYLHKGFPEGTQRRRLNAALASLRVFRNRVAHHEHVLSGAEGERRRIVYVVRMLSPEVSDHLAATSEISTILSQRP